MSSTYLSLSRLRISDMQPEFLHSPLLLNGTLLQLVCSSQSRGDFISSSPAMKLCQVTSLMEKILYEEHSSSCFSLMDSFLSLPPKIAHSSSFLFTLPVYFLKSLSFLELVMTSSVVYIVRLVSIPWRICFMTFFAFKTWECVRSSLIESFSPAVQKSVQDYGEFSFQASSCLFLQTLRA